MVSGHRVRRGETIVLDPDDGLVASGRDRRQTILDAISGLRPGYELITVYYGADAGLGEAEELAQAIGRHERGVEVEVLRGGQPHYHFLLSAE